MSNTEKTLTVQEGQLALPESPLVTAIKALSASGMNREGVEAIKELAALQWKMEEREAQKQFASALADLQGETSHIVAERPVPTKTGGVKYMFAPYEVIMREVQPLLKKHGFTVRFDTQLKGANMIVFCILTHRGGHSEKTSQEVTIGSGPPDASKAQADGSATTYAKRFALCNALNIVIEKDTDARILGENIAPEIAADFERRIAHIDRIEPGSMDKFLRLAGVSSLSEIKGSKVPVLTKALLVKEAKLKKDAAK